LKQSSLVRTPVVTPRSRGSRGYCHCDAASLTTKVQDIYPAAVLDGLSRYVDTRPHGSRSTDDLNPSS